MTIVKHKPFFVNNLLDDLFHTMPELNYLNKLASAVNIYETKDGFHLEMNAAGRAKENFKIQLEKGTLTISYDKKEEVKDESYKTLKENSVLKVLKEVSPLIAILKLKKLRPNMKKEFC